MVLEVETPTGENIHSMHKDNSLGWATDIPSSTSGLKWLRSLGRLESFNTGIIRDYKEHGTRNKDESSLRRDETALSSPSLSSWSTPSSRSRDERSSSSSGSNDSGLSSRSSSSSGSPSSTSEKYSNSGNVETVFVKRYLVWPCGLVCLHLTTFVISSTQDWAKSLRRELA
uniref:Uncharacterized protein n=1 Tax=Timema shepardi TaxID=629360 RepID=A0A7R9B0S0_TIMSH|nr:unnamed protein product [Timema shepardi]